LVGSPDELEELELLDELDDEDEEDTLTQHPHCHLIGSSLIISYHASEQKSPPGRQELGPDGSQIWSINR
jgi:hypothetical protein